MSVSREGQLNRILYELQLMEGTSNALQQRGQILTSAVTELRLSQMSLNEMKDIREGTPLLVPVGGNAFVHAKTSDISRVIIGIGADVSVEVPLEKALEDVGKRLEEIEKALKSVDEQLVQILSQMQTHQDVANRLANELQGVQKRV